MPYPTKALQEYVLKSELPTLTTSLGITGPQGAPGNPGSPGVPGANGTNGTNGASWSPAQSSTAPAIINGGTIATAGLTASRVAPAGVVTGVVLQGGTIGGQQVTVINESSFSITFAVASTSNVATGVSCVIPALTHLQFVWSSGSNLWYPAGGAGAGGGGGATAGQYDIAAYDSAVYG